MGYVSILHDHRINSKNVAFEIKVEDYLEIAKNTIRRNPFQRRKVKASATIYSLLKKDLKRSCIIPPIVVAISSPNVSESSITDTSISDDILELIKENVDAFLILDGLQRTHTMIDLENDLIASDDQDLLETFYKHKIRLELYFGINKLGILYRMLTLNTGQTPMSLRHQIEILYSDYLTDGIEGVTLLKEVDDARATRTNEYNFRDIIEGFNSYLERNELPIDKLNLLENIKGLEKLAKENESADLFVSFVLTFHSFIQKVNEISGSWVLDSDEIILSGQPFGKTIESIFKKSQVLTGFGAAIGRLKDVDIVDDIADIKSKIDHLEIEDANDAFINLLGKLDEIRNTAKKIGNAQRMFFQYFFRELFNEETDSYPFIDKAIDNAYQKYLSQVA